MEILTTEVCVSYDARQNIMVARYRGKRRYSRIKTRAIIDEEKALERLEARL